jgi:predicted  nucleic acid-binding Zn-ribbon protein
MVSLVDLFFVFKICVSYIFNLLSIAMSIDLQQSSAPLLRQLESTERQGRARAGAWADLETKLRSEIEEQVIDKEKLQKNKNELEVDMKRANRALQEKESKLVITQSSIDDLRTSLGEVSARYENTISELESLKIEHSNIQKYLKDIESNVRAEFFNTLREDEERFNDQVESLEVELRQERERRTSLEEKIQEMMEAEQKYDGSEMSSVQKSAKSPKRNLGSKVNQADILQDTLFGIDPDDDDDDDDDVNSTDLDPEVKDEKMNNGTGSFAFIEQLSQSLKATKSERDTLRKQLDESEERRGVLENEAIASIEATQALPLLRAQASQLARDANEKDMEIQALQEDINEVRDIYKTQLNTLLGGDASHGTSTQDSIPPSQLVTSEVKTSVKKSVIPSSFNGMRTF